MGGWVVIIGAGLAYEAHALRGRAPTLSFVIRKAPKAARAAALAWAAYHFLGGDS